MNPFSMPISSPTVVCKLNHFLYGLNQTPKTWFENFCNILIGFSFTHSHYDSFIFLQRTSNGIVMLIIYVDDIVTNSNITVISEIQKLMHSTFNMKDLV